VGIECAAFRDEDILKKPQAIVAQRVAQSTNNPALEEDCRWLLRQKNFMAYS